MARVGIDLDGVLYPFEDALRDYLGKPDLPPATKWDFYEEWGLTRGEFVELCEAALAAGYLFWRGDPYQGAIEQVDRLMNAGHEIVFITNRAFVSVEKCRGATEYWLGDWWWEGSEYELHLVADKTTVPVDYMIDDNYENYLAMYEAGVNSFLCTRPWNAHAKVTQRGTLKEYVDLVLRCEEGNRLDESIQRLESVSRNSHSETNGNNEAQEVRVTSATGGQKGKKLAAFHLLPQKALWEVAELYGKGAEKYTKYGECTCASVEKVSMREECVEAATTSGSKSTILNTANDSWTITNNGSVLTEIRSMRTAEGGTLSSDQGLIDSTASPAKSTTPSSTSLAESVDESPNISTMTTNAVSEGVESASGAASATDATWGAATSKDGSRSTESKHLPGCPALTVVEQGDHNWRKGYDWSLSYAAMQRHANLFWSGQDYDEETGCHHLTSVVFHALALLTFRTEHPEYDDRFRA